MKKRYFERIISATLLTILSISSLGATSVFATNVNYGIDYDTANAQLLGQDGEIANVNIDPDLINSLEPLIDNNDIISTSFQGDWNEGYISDSSCKKVHYFTVAPGGAYDQGYSVVMANSQYYATVQIVNVSVISQDNFTKPAAVTVVDDTNWIFGGWEIYDSISDSGACQNKNNSIGRVVNGNAYLFIETSIKLYKKNQSPVVSSELYMGLTDVDAGQSYAILNENNMLSRDNMYAKSFAALQQSSAYPNYYVPDNSEGKSYIFSAYTRSGIFNSPSNSDIYVKLKPKTQSDGLQMVFGFASNAASGIEYYAKQYQVNYVSDGNGEVGLDTEPVIAGENPSGSETTPDTGFAFAYWIADQDVTLENGATISAGLPLSDDDILEVVVNKNITFTAYFAKQYTVTYKSDDNGSITGVTSEDVIENGNPTGTNQASKAGYTLSHWIANVDVALEDDTEIKAGSPITTEQLSQVIVTEDITFTAIHTPKVAVPDTGTISQGIDAAQIATFSITGLIICGLAIWYLPRALHKKVRFDK